MDLVKINELLLTNEIDYSSLLILYDLSNNTDLFKNYFINMRRIMHRRNIDMLKKLENIHLLKNLMYFIKDLS